MVEVKVRILVVDDYQANIDSLTALIASEDVEVLSAKDGQKALELITKFEFGLALLDVEMPDMSGLALAKLIRGVSKFKSLPIIFVTAHAADSNVVFSGYETGAVDVLVKPLVPQMVRAKVRTFVELAYQKKLLSLQVAEMQRLKAIAESASAARGSFLANMSHEIRTPLNAILGYTSLIKSKSYDGVNLEEIGEVIHRNGDVLLRLIDDILDFTKVDSGHVEIVLSDFDFQELISDISETCRIRADEKNVELIWSLPRNSQVKFRSDPIRIKQILLNIIGNAIKFSSGKKVEITADFVNAINANLQGIRIDVRDYGIGLSPIQQERIFSPFQQANAEISRKFGGTGLGLVISQRIAHALGGDVALISSKENEGSHFQIRFELERIVSSKKSDECKRDSEISKPSKYDFSGKRILIVDDISDNRNLINLYLRKSGANLKFAVDGRLGVEAALGSPFDLILMDIQMPEMDGYEATEILRKAGLRCPIVALTAHAIKSEIERCLSSGCSSVLTKPISFESLNQTLASYLGIEAAI